MFIVILDEVLDLSEHSRNSTIKFSDISIGASIDVTDAASKSSSIAECSKSTDSIQPPTSIDASIDVTAASKSSSSKSTHSIQSPAELQFKNTNGKFNFNYSILFIKYFHLYIFNLNFILFMNILVFS